MQKTKLISKFIGLAIFFIAIGAVLNTNKTVLADNISGDDMKIIQNAIANSTNQCIKACFAGVMNAKTVDEFKNIITNASGITGNYISSCISVTPDCQGDPGTTANKLLSALQKYVKTSNQENLNAVLAILGVSGPHDTTGCITDENNAQLKNWLEQLANNEFIKNYKASSNCANTPLTLACLKKSIVPKIQTDILGYQRGEPALATLYSQYLNDYLIPFINCPTQNNFDNLNKFYNDYFVTEKEKIIYNQIGYTEPPQTPECAIGYSGGSFWNLITQPINILVGAIITLFTNILKFLLKALILVFWWSLYNLPKSLGGYTHFEPIQNLWKILVSYANLGIVLGMIFTSIATFFGNEKYSWKKMFPKLIVLALLVNFTLLLCGIVIDISNYLTFIFLPGGDGSGLAETIINVVNGIICALRGANESFSYTMGATVGLIVTSVLIFQFIGLIYFVLKRYGIILLSVVTSPLAALAMAIDAGPFKDLAAKWRNNFTTALVNIVILSLAFYFSLTIINSLSQTLNQLSNNSINGVNGGASFIELVAYAIFVIVIIQLVRIVANSVGVKEVEAGFNFAKQLTTAAVIGGSMAAGNLLGTKLFNSEVWQNAQSTLLKKGAEGNVVLGNMGKWMSKTSTTFTTQRYKAYEEALKGQSEDELRISLNTALVLRDHEKAVRAMAQLAEKKKIDPVKDFNTLKQLVKYPSFNSVAKKSFENNYPDLAKAISNPNFSIDPNSTYINELTNIINNRLPFVDRKNTLELANWKLAFSYLEKTNNINSFNQWVSNAISNNNNENQIKTLLNNLSFILLSSLDTNKAKTIAQDIYKRIPQNKINIVQQTSFYKILVQ